MPFFRTIPFYLAPLSEEERLAYGHQLNATIPQCTFDGVKCDLDDFETFSDNALGSIHFLKI